MQTGQQTSLAITVHSRWQLISAASVKCKSKIRTVFHLLQVASLPRQKRKQLRMDKAEADRSDRIPVTSCSRAGNLQEHVGSEKDNRGKRSLLAPSAYAPTDRSIDKPRDPLQKRTHHFVSE